MFEPMNFIHMYFFSDDSTLEKDEHPEHKIYRKSTIRFSLLQRFRAMISEEQRRNVKLPTYKQGSKSMGAKIANPQYADPQKLFASTSQINLQEEEETRKQQHVDIDVNDLIGEPEVIDLSLNESEVMNEFDRRLRISREDSNITDTGQLSPTNKKASTLTKIPTMPQITTTSFSGDSTVNIESYYENILDKNLSSDGETTEEFCDRNTPFKSKEIRRSLIKRPTKAPPPIPVKPARLSLQNNRSLLANSITADRTVTEISNLTVESPQQGLSKSKSDNGWFNININANNSTISSNNVISFFKSEAISRKINSSYDMTHGDAPRENIQAKGWVKMIVDRFE